MEDLLSKTEINDVIRRSRLGVYSYLFGLIPSKNKVMISQVCTQSGLILVNGNQATGYQHILERHSPTSRLPYWRKEKIGTPTKFKHSITPIHYLRIARGIFNDRSKILQETDSSPFDLYKGFLPDETGEILEYTLLTYKGNGIIHTLYMSDKRYVVKKAFLNLERGNGSSSYDIMKCVQTIVTPYFNSKNIEKYKSITQVYEVQRIEKRYLQINNKYGAPLVTCLINQISLNEIIPFVHQMTLAELNGNVDIETCIKSIQTNLNIPKHLLEVIRNLDNNPF